MSRAVRSARRHIPAATVPDFVSQTLFCSRKELLPRGERSLPAKKRARPDCMQRGDPRVGNVLLFIIPPNRTLVNVFESLDYRNV
jgi:hypothetical protein